MRGMSVVLACRTFDLENDPNIRKWKETVERRFKGRVEQIKLGLLDAETVEGVTAEFQVKLADLPRRVQRLLMHPFTLDIWHDLSNKGQIVRDFSTMTDLLRQFLEARQAEVVHTHNVSESQLSAVLDALVGDMDRVGKTTASETVVPNAAGTLNALCSVGLLERAGSTLSFPHQIYFDHLVAQRILAKTGRAAESIVHWVKENQGLFRRDQLRHLLFLLRDDDSIEYVRVLRGLLTDETVRFHLKQLALGILRIADPPSEAEVGLARQLAEHADWKDHIGTRVFRGNPVWFDALNGAGVLSAWLAGDDAERIRATLGIIQSVSNDRGKAIDDLLKPYWEKGGGWDERLEATIPFDSSADSPKMAELRRMNIRSGKWAMPDVFLDRVAKKAPERVVPLLEAGIRGNLRRVLSDPDAKGPLWQIHDHILDRGVDEAVRADGNRGWRAFSRQLLIVIRLGEFLKRRSAAYRVTHVLENASKLLDRLISGSVAGLSNTAPDSLHEVLNSADRAKLSQLDRAVARGLIDAPTELSNEIIDWFCRTTKRFQLGDNMHETKWAPAREVLKRHAQCCSDQSFERLEAAILSYHDPWERESFEYRHGRIMAGIFEVGAGPRRKPLLNAWGRAQNVLLGALPRDRLSEVGRHRAFIWRSKFGDPDDERPELDSVGGRVKSPIPPQNLLRVSNKEWIRIATGQWSDRTAEWRQLDADTVSERSHETLSNAFAEAVRRQPTRFARLALKLPTTVPTTYFSHLLWELARTSPPDNAPPDWEPASVEEISAVIEHRGDCDDEFYARSVCWVVKHRASEEWPQSVMDRLLSYAWHLDPKPDEFSVHSGGGPDQAGAPDIASSAINCVRGSVSTAIRVSLGERWGYLAKLTVAARALLGDPHPAVRHEAIGICLSYWKHDRQSAIASFLTACDHPDDRVLSSRWVHRFVSCARWSELDSLEPVIRRKARSIEPEVAENGALWATACMLQQDGLSDLMDECLCGNPAQRKGVAEAACQLYSHDDTADGAFELLIRLLDDDDAEVRRTAASVLRDTDSLSRPTAPKLAATFASSRASDENAESLIHPLSEYTGDLMRFKEAILTLANRLADDFDPKTRNVERPWAFIGGEMSTLLLRLYERALSLDDSDLAESCLDRWDAMLAAGFGEVEAHLGQLDGTQA